jgi:ATP-dependent Clp protease ATP-binding subunit ClpC
VRLCQLRSCGYQPHYGARERKRQIRLEVETFLARELLGEAFKSGKTVRQAFDAAVSQVSITPVDSPPTKQKPRKISKGEHAEDVA